MGGTFTAAGDEDGGDTRVLQNDDEGDGDESVAVSVAATRLKSVGVPTPLIGIALIWYGAQLPFGSSGRLGRW